MRLSRVDPLGQGRGEIPTPLPARHDPFLDRTMLCPPVPGAKPGWLADHAGEDAREVGLRLESDRQGHVDQGHIRARELFLSPLDPATEQVLLRPQAGRGLELRGEVQTREPHRGGDVGEAHRLGEVGFDVFHRALEPPFRELGDLGPLGCIRLPEGEKPRDDRSRCRPVAAPDPLS
jgi:hypothetical protein